MLRPRFVGRTSVADAVTVCNAALGFVACALAFVDTGLAARVVLLAAITDGLDGVAARYLGSTPMGSYLDSLADVASFGVAPALVVFAVVRPADLATPFGVASVALPALFVAMAVLRLGLYTAYDTDHTATEGVQTTLAATVLAVAHLTGALSPALLLGLLGAFAYLMVTRIPYPDLYARDALIMGVVQAGAVFLPGFLDGAFPWALLIVASSYLVGGPVFYWRSARREEDRQAT